LRQRLSEDPDADTAGGGEPAGAQGQGQGRATAKGKEGQARRASPVAAADPKYRVVVHCVVSPLAVGEKSHASGMRAH
jgi:hypothetical protein